MNPEFRRKAARHPLVKLLLHPVITLTGLFLLLLLVFFGTLYQADHGLYEAQRVFFGYVIPVAGVVPFPGTSTVLWVLSIQLVLTLLLVMPLHWKKAGLWIVHTGLLLLLIGGFITQMLAVESQLTLAEGETGHYTTAYQDWEAAVWTARGDTNDVVAYTDRHLRPGAVLDLDPHPARLKVREYHSNAAAFTSSATGGTLPYLNAAGIAAMERRPPEKEAPQNAPGLIATLSEEGEPDREILLFGLEPRPLALTVGGQRVFFKLRRRHYPLSFSLTLNKFVRELHPGTEVAKAYESHLDLEDGLSSRPVRIWMNNPLRYQGYTFYQASFALDAQGAHSTLAVVTNPGRLIPYISSLMVFGGLLLHFALHFLGYVRRTARA